MRIIEGIAISIIAIALMGQTPEVTPVPPAPQGELPIEPLIVGPGNPPTVTTGVPVVINGVLSSTHVTILIPGTGSGWMWYMLTNESLKAGIRCEFGGIGGTPPIHEPSVLKGHLIAPMVTWHEHTAPSNRLDCVGMDLFVPFDLVLYPR